jgi:hypothetical protein
MLNQREGVTSTARHADRSQSVNRPAAGPFTGFQSEPHLATLKVRAIQFLSALDRIGFEVDREDLAAREVAPKGIDETRRAQRC